MVESNDKIDKELLGQLFQSIARENPQTLAIVKELADTAHVMDPDCPYGAHGVLGSIRDYGLSPIEINKLYNLLGKDVLKLNAVDYAVDTGSLNVEDIKKSIKQKDVSNLNPDKRIMEAKVASHGRYAQHYKR